jgi:hypothetical protein
VRSYPSARAGRSHARPRPRTEPQRRLTPAKLDSASRSHLLDCLGAAFGPPLLLRVSAAPLSGAFPDGARLASGRLLAFRRSEHDRIVGYVIIRALGEPVVIGCDPKHHRPNCWIVSLFRQRPHFLGSHAPVRWGLEEIIRVGTALAPQNGLPKFTKKGPYHVLFRGATLKVDGARKSA